jgi:5'-phosphate synthase pdxT subunit
VEHFAILSKLSKSYPITSILVRTPDDLALCSALIIPGGESTTIGLLARLAGLLDPLRDFIKRGKPVWGTCAGAILLADGGIEGGKRGQEVLGGVDVKIGRNGWGSQVCLGEWRQPFPVSHPSRSM